ncbi:MAG: ABC transporter ATP-binding protein [Amylibacter sp.]|nr:ABC transporter ATP-binding protein [Amylibacter sp.]
MPSSQALKISDISVEFSGLKALDHVSMHLNPGEILGLIGPNGSGKTTTINAITGQVPLSTGTVSAGEDTLSGLSPRKIARLGIARSFQIVRLFNDLTVEENVEASALAQGEGRRKARIAAQEMLAEFDLMGRADELAGNLNYGDKRRVEIARALVAKPRFLLLDEPAAGMNEAESETLLNLLSILPKQRNLGLLIIDHDMPLIMRLSHRVHVLASGRTIAEGDVNEVRNNPAVIEAYLGSSAEVSA